MTEADELLHTPLYDLHVEHGARIVPFAGYAMPVQYADGILAEHRWTREKAGLFDVSHMGQARLRGDDPAGALETLTPGDIKGVGAGQQRYTLLMNDEGGVNDDLMVSRPDDDGLFLVVNASEKASDIAYMRERLGPGYEVEQINGRALLALQGPSAHAVMERIGANVTDMIFMQSRHASIAGFDCIVSRSGYTGEDGFEISVASNEADGLARALLADDDVRPIGLGARDSLRLEAGLCLYGHDIDRTTSPVEASLLWAVAKRRREEGGFPGHERVMREIADGPTRKRVGFEMPGRLPAREGAIVFDPEFPDTNIGVVTSGGFAPSVNAPIGMAYVTPRTSSAGQPVEIEIRGRRHAAEIAKTPFTPHRYRRA